jgi:hypothetical protein
VAQDVGYRPLIRRGAEGGLLVGHPVEQGQEPRPLLLNQLDYPRHVLLRLVLQVGDKALSGVIVHHALLPLGQIAGTDLAVIGRL